MDGISSCGRVHERRATNGCIGANGCTCPTCRWPSLPPRGSSSRNRIFALPDLPSRGRIRMSGPLSLRFISIGVPTSSAYRAFPTLQISFPDPLCLLQCPPPILPLPTLPPPILRTAPGPPTLRPPAGRLPMRRLSVRRLLAEKRRTLTHRSRKRRPSAPTAPTGFRAPTARTADRSGDLRSRSSIW